MARPTEGRDMRKFYAGLALGLAIGAAGSAAAAEIVGRTGYLNGWDVVSASRTICSDPYVWTATREIEC